MKTGAQCRVKNRGKMTPRGTETRGEQVSQQLKNGKERDLTRDSVAAVKRGKLECDLALCKGIVPSSGLNQKTPVTQRANWGSQEPEQIPAMYPRP
jgi:hypothetical protein